MNNEKTEKQLISLILESSKHSMKLTKKYLPKTKKLFEDVFYQEEIASPISYKDCRNNKLFYFQQVKDKVIELRNETNKESLSIINESLASENFKDSVKTFIGDLDKEINELKYQNDFSKIEVLNPIIQKTLSFSKRPINVNGFDIQQILDPNNSINLELLEKFGANVKSDLKLLVFNKSDKELYFLFERANTKEKTIIFYNITTNTLDYIESKDFYEEFGSDKNQFFKEIWKDETKYLKIIGKYINNNLYELYRNSSLYDITFVDNLYGDFAYQKRKEIIQSQNVIKSSRN